MDFFIPGPEGRLEALYHPPADREVPLAVAVVCHPHPAHGGNMHSTVTFKTARGLQSAGIACLRINFRGVGKSEGHYHGEGGEEGDALAALEWLAERHPGTPWWAAGFSFGSRTVFGLARREARIERLALIGFPLKAFDLPGLTEVRQPTLMIWGSEDEFGTLADFHAQYPEVPEHFDLLELPGADHFFKRHTKELEDRVAAWAKRQLQGALR